MNKKSFRTVISSSLLMASLMLNLSCGGDAKIDVPTFYDPSLPAQSSPSFDPASDLSRRAVDGINPKVVIKNTFFRVHKEVGILINDMFAELVTTIPGDPPSFDNVNTFNVRVHQGNVVMNGKAMDNLMRLFTLNYPNAPLSELKHTITQGRITITGKMKQAGLKVPFEMSGAMHSTPDGLMELTPDKIKTAGLPVKGLLDFVGLETAKLINVNEQRGMKLVGNAIVLNPAKLFPPPVMQGRVTRVECNNDALNIFFDDGTTLERPPLPVAEGIYKNYKHIYGGALRLGGNETHENANILIVDMNQSNPFDFFLAEYATHLMAGQVNVLNRNGTLLTTMPDYEDIPKRLGKRPIFNTPDDGLAPEQLQLNPKSNPKLTKQNSGYQQPRN